VASYLARDAAEIREVAGRTEDLDDDGDGVFLTYALLLRAKGSDVSAADVHDAWATWILLSGRRHAQVVPFDDLDAASQARDEPFARAIREVAHRRAVRGRADDR
jgi:hypothetical protein